MDEWFDKLKVLWEWSRFYPQPARYFFGFTACLVFVSALLFLVYRRGASEAKAASEFADAIPLSVDADVAIPAVQVPEENGVPDDRALRYQVDTAPGGVVVTPVLPYLDHWNRGEEVEALNVGATRFRWRFPLLDVRLSNNTDNPLILNKVIVDVAESAPEDNPLISVVSDFNNLMSFRVLTPIAKELTGCVVEYDVAPTGSGPTTPLSVFRADLPVLSGSDVVAVDDALAAKGAKPALLRADPVTAYKLFMTGNPVPAMGTFKKGTVVVRGQLRATRGDKVLGPFRFRVEVALVPPGPQALMPPTAIYDAMLREYGKGYSVEVRTDNEIAPKGPERIMIRLAAPRSSYHEFRLRLQFHDGRVRVSDIIRLHLLRPE